MFTPDNLIEIVQTLVILSQDKGLTEEGRQAIAEAVRVIRELASKKE